MPALKVSVGTISIARCRKLSYLFSMAYFLGDRIQLLDFLPFFTKEMPASVAKLDARLTSDQEVAGSTPAGSATLIIGD